jgi:transposase-like protein
MGDNKNFRMFYLASRWFGKMDKEIAVELGISKDTLYRWKKKAGLVKGRNGNRIRKNQQGLSQEQLRTAEKNGIDRHNALRRRRVYGWSKVDAISVPLQRRRMYE